MEKNKIRQEAAYKHKFEQRKIIKSLNIIFFIK